VVSAYGYMNCVAPNGVHIRAIVGDKLGDEISYVAVRCGEGANVDQVAEEWVKDIEGLRKWKEVPSGRPGGQDELEPRTFPGAVYLGAGEEGARESGCGVLLLPSWYKADGTDEEYIGKKLMLKEKIGKAVKKGRTEGGDFGVERKVVEDRGVKEIGWMGEGGGRTTLINRRLHVSNQSSSTST